MITRRDFVKLSISSIVASQLMGTAGWAREDRLPFFASGYKDKNGEYGVALISEKGEVMAMHKLSARGHGLCFHKASGRLVIFARRPGTLALALDVHQRAKPDLFLPRKDTHFYGHGTFSADGQLIYATENLYREGTGLIGVYDVTNNYKRLGDFSTHGIGPHDVALLPDGKTLCVANGGIRTHPETGRVKLNLSTMRSSICFIDVNTGALEGKIDVPEKFQRLSLRHMAVSEAGKVWLGGQYEGARSHDVPLVATATLTDGLQFVNIEPEIERHMAHYIGSVSYNRESGYIGFSSPKGGQMFILDAQTGKLIGHKETDQVCGLAAKGGSFIQSTMHGLFDGKTTSIKWDNHMIAL